MLHSSSFDEAPHNDDNSYSDLGRQVKDENRQVRVKVAFLGLGMLTPWCIIIGAPDYWIESVGSDEIGADMSFTFMIFNFLSLGLCVYMSQYSTYWNTNPGNITAFAYFIFLLPLAFVSVATKLEYGVLLFVSCCFGLGQGISQTEVFKLIATLPKVYTGDCVAGQALAGLLFSALRLVTKSNDDKNTSDGITVYFLCGILIIFTSVLIAYFLPQDPFVQQHATNGHRRRRSGYDNNNDPNANIQMSTGSNFSNNNNKSKAGASYETLYDEQEEALNNSENSSASVSDNMNDLSTTHNNKTSFESFKAVTLEIKHHGLLVFLIFCCSLMFFPALTTHMHSKNGAGTWFPVINGMIFNVFDFVGRVCGQKYPIQEKWWTISVVGRLIFSLLFFPLAYYFFDDIFVYLLVMLLAMSNGMYN